MNQASVGWRSGSRGCRGPECGSWTISEQTRQNQVGPGQQTLGDLGLRCDEQGLPANVLARSSLEKLENFLCRNEKLENSDNCTQERGLEPWPLPGRVMGVTGVTRRASSQQVPTCPCTCPVRCRVLVRGPLPGLVVACDGTARTGSREEGGRANIHAVTLRGAPAAGTGPAETCPVLPDSPEGPEGGVFLGPDWRTKPFCAVPGEAPVEDRAPFNASRSTSKANVVSWLLGAG